VRSWAAVRHVQDDRDVICFCEWVTRDDLIATIPYVRNAKELRETTRACTTCFGCEADLDDLVAAHADAFATALD
jgi:NAD(P)H-nitrite reductase large subunit